ncbi:MAG TPA: ATP-binding protein [Candidatus Limnocylindria bacterium]|jgi:two-component system sensor histidine kinase BaeS|nr:ATP-binding protein [Candidatus Limnocylindria bacterium]
MQRLNVRLVIALASVALVALLVSGATLNQILPGLFVSQAETRAFVAAQATGLLMIDRATTTPPNVLLTPELRNTQFLLPVAQTAANTLAQGTVSIFNPDGSLAASASPDDEADAEFRSQGLRPDPEVANQGWQTTLRDLPGISGSITFTIVVSQPYTTRLVTLDSVRGTLLFTGLIALVVSMVVGALVARRLTTPLARLRRAASRLAQGQLDERAPRSDILEIDDLARQFNVMADRLSESLRMLEADRDQLREFVADVSHELRTPIAALRAFTELQRDGQVDDATRREFLDRSSEQISRLDWMSTNLLDLSRIDAGIFPLDVRSGDLRDPIRSVVEAHAELAEQRGVSLISEVPPAPVMLRFDRERIVQLLSNLVGNGLKFTPRGGQVSVQLTDAPEGAALEVRDSGPGILAAELPHIFERFFRGTNVGEARASGSGLGLAIARSIVEMHGGQIEVASKIGEGSAFTVRLPRGAPALPGQ